MLVGGQEDMSKKRMARATPDDYVRQAPSSTQRQVGSTLDRTALMSCQASLWHGKIMERQQNHRLKIKGVPWGFFSIVFETMVMNITEHHQLGCEWCGPRNSPRPKKNVRRHIFCTHCTNELNMGYQIWVPSWDPTASPKIIYNPPFSVGWIPILVYSVMTILADFHFLLLQSIILGAPHICLSNPNFSWSNTWSNPPCLLPYSSFLLDYAWLIWYNYRFG